MASCRLTQFSKLLILAALGVIIIVSCSKDSKPTPITSAIPKDDLPIVKPKGNEKYLREKSDYIYNQAEVKTYELIIKKDDLAKINANPATQAGMDLPASRNALAFFMNFLRNQPMPRTNMK